MTRKYDELPPLVPEGIFALQRHLPSSLRFKLNMIPKALARKRYADFTELVAAGLDVEDSVLVELVWSILSRKWRKNQDEFLEWSGLTLTELRIVRQLVREHKYKILEN